MESKGFGGSCPGLHGKLSILYRGSKGAGPGRWRGWPKHWLKPMNKIAQSLRRKTQDGRRKTKIRPPYSVFRPLSSVRGVVLIAVLWCCALIMWFAFQISAQTRLLGEDRIHAIRDSQALYLAIGDAMKPWRGLGQAPPLGMDKPHDLNWQPDGRPRIVEYKSGIAVVIIEPEELKVNVNKVQQVQLMQVLQRAGADEFSSEELADRIMDFIDADDIRRPHGMERGDYIKAGLNYIPFDGPLTSLDQLLLVPGLSHQLFYGYDHGIDERMSEFPEIFQDIVIPAQKFPFQPIVDI